MYNHRTHHQDTKSGNTDDRPPTSKRREFAFRREVGNHCQWNPLQHSSELFRGMNRPIDVVHDHTGSDASPHGKKGSQ